MILVCPRCFGDQGLKKRITDIRPSFPNEKCDFHPKYKGVPIEAVTEIVDPVFRAHYVFGDYGYQNEQLGDPLQLCVGELTEAIDEVSEVLSQNLIESESFWPPDGGEPFYDDSQNYERYEPQQFYHSELWDNFCESVLHDQRFFNAEAKSLVSEIFEEIQFQRDYEKQPPVYVIEPGTKYGTFYRARIANDSSNRKEISADVSNQLGAPPKRLRRAGRMNPAGIACFYGAYDMTTCVAELRPTVGDVIVGATFKLCRPIHVLDTTRFNAPIKPQSLFSEKYLDRKDQWEFMSNFRHMIAQPISRKDEYLDYIPTQAVAEYLLNHHKFKRDGKTVRIEAIIFQSAQNPTGKNIALLGEAAFVRQDKADLKRSHKIEGSDSGILDPFESFRLPRNEGSNPALVVDQTGFRTHRVKGAKYDAPTFDDFDFNGDDMDF